MIVVWEGAMMANYPITGAPARDDVYGDVPTAGTTVYDETAAAARAEVEAALSALYVARRQAREGG